jgi:hypothetical protein
MIQVSNQFTSLADDDDTRKARQSTDDTDNDEFDLD